MAGEDLLRASRDRKGLALPPGSAGEPADLQGAAGHLGRFLRAEGRT